MNYYVMVAKERLVNLLKTVLYLMAGSAAMVLGVWVMLFILSPWLKR